MPLVPAGAGLDGQELLPVPVRVPDLPVVPEPDSERAAPQVPRVQDAVRPEELPDQAGGGEGARRGRGSRGRGAGPEEEAGGEGAGEEARGRGVAEAPDERAGDPEEPGVPDEPAAGDREGGGAAAARVLWAVREDREDRGEQAQPVQREPPAGPP